MTAPPARIHDYRIVDVLGRGGMGVVYLAEHAPTGAPAAVKTVRVPTEAALESLRREIHTLGELRHPGIVRIRDHGVDGGVPWYAMDLLEGATLRDYFEQWWRSPAAAGTNTRDLRGPALVAPAVPRPRPRDGAPQPPPWSLPLVLRVFRRLCEPLAFLHGLGIVHRDLSPANVFLVRDPDGGDDDVRPVVFDFGLAAAFRVDTTRDVLEVGGFVRGTTHYMAPEQVRGEVVDARADVYGLGCVLFEALTGRPPFVAETSMAVLMQHLEDPPPRPSAVAPGLPAALDDLVVRMLAKRPRDRIGYVEDVARALEALGGGPSAGAGPTARAYTYRPGLSGRAELLRRFDDLIGRLARRTGGCAVVTGESGIGKTRLVAEVATRAAASELRVVTGECVAVAPGARVGGARAAPLHPLRGLLQQVADRCRELGPDEAARLLGFDGALLAAYEPALADVAPPGDDPALAGPPSRDRVIAAVAELLVAYADGAPLLLVLDDLQWADELTVAVLRGLGRELLVANGILLVATVRAEEVDPELDAALRALGAARIAIDRLDAPAVGEMVRDMLALDDDAPALTQFVAAQSEGNPFFAAEYLRVAVDEGVLRRDAHGRWRLPGRDEPSYDRLPVPSSIQALVRRRLGGLSAEARAVATTAAVLGREAEVGVIVAASGLDDARAMDGVAELMMRHVVDEARPGVLRFEHDKLREIAYAELGEPDRRDRHRRAATALEARHAASPDLALLHGELAHHWEAAGAHDRAAAHLEQACVAALDRAAFGELAASARRLLALDLAVDPVRRARWERWGADACYALGDLPASADHARAALGHLGWREPTSKLGWVGTVVGGAARQVVRRVRPARDDGRDPRHVEAALAAGRLSYCYLFDDDALGMVGAALVSVNHAERAGRGVPVAEPYAQLGYVAGLGRLARVADGYLERARQTARATSDPLGLVKAHSIHAAYAVGVAAWADARREADRCLALARELRNPQEEEVALTILGHVEYATGHLVEARRLAVMLLDSARRRANAQHEAWGLYTAGRADLATGELDRAIALFDEARALLDQQSDHASLILCGGMHALAWARKGDAARARQLADETTARIGRRVPAVFSLTEGFAGAAEAYLHLWETSLHRDYLRAATPARAAVDNLARFARVFPVARAAALVHAARAARLGHRPRRAARLARRALAAAVRLGRPLDEAAAHAELGDLAAARAIWTRLGARWHLARVGGPASA